MTTSLKSVLPTQASAVTLTPPATTVLRDSQRDACAPIDVLDINPRAYRDAKGHVVMFPLHYVNRPLRGRSGRC